MQLAEPFRRVESPLHRLDPGVKLFSALVFATVVAVAVKSAGLLGAALVLALLLVAACRPNLGWLLRRLAAANVFVLFLWLILPWSVPGDSIWRLGPLTLRAEGFSMAAAITLKCNAIVLAMIALLATSGAHRLAAAMGRLGAPRRLVVVLFLCVRYLRLIYDEGMRIRQAAKLRGFIPGTSLATYRTYAELVGALLVRSHERAARVYQAMLCRGFTGRFPEVRDRSAGPVDYAFGASMLLISVGMGVLDWRLRT